MTFHIAAFYKFFAFSDFAQHQARLLACCQANAVKGSILLASEGINGTIAGPQAGVQAVLAHLQSDPRLADLQHKKAWANQAPFYRMKVRLKREIVTLGQPAVNTAQGVGQYVQAANWNALISDANVVVVDTRNDYEVEMGSFARALNPRIQSFSQLPAWLAQHSALQPSNGIKPKVAMFCTGGIRCEKSTAWLRAQGYSEVYHLEGGILQYLESVPATQSLWQGECFVFDERVSVGHGLTPSTHDWCRACRRPLKPENLHKREFEAGVSCHHCVHVHSEAQKNSARERQRQWERAKTRALKAAASQPAKPAAVLA
jgi:UPF0176 protein